MKAALLLLALFGLTFAKDIPSYVRRGHFEGRSGNVVITPSGHRSPAGVMLLDHFHSSKEESIDDVNVANLIAHLFQSPPPSNEKDLFSIDRSFFPTLSLFDAPAANVFIAVESVDASVLEKYPALSLLQKRKQMEVKSTFQIHNSLADIETLITGVPPAQHGIVGKTWLSAEGTESTAFSDSGSGSRADSLFDVLALTSPKSLMVSMSSDNSVAAAVGVRVPTHYDSPNVLSYTWNSYHQTFDSVTGKKLSIKSSRADILSALESENAFQFEGITLRMDPNNMQLFVSARSTEVNSVAFDLNSEEDFRIFVELFFLAKVSNSLANDLAGFVNDDHPDSFALAFHGISTIRAKYGVKSPQFSAALYLLDSAVSVFLQNIQTLYQKKATTQIVFIPSKGALFSEAVLEQVNEIVPSVGGFKNFLPEIYMGDELSSVEEAGLVARLNHFLESHGFEAFWFGKQDLHAQDMFLVGDNYHHRRSNGAQSLQTRSEDGDDTTYTQSEVENFQIQLWTSFFLILITIGSCCSMCLLNPEKNNEILYRQTALGRETDTIPGGEYDFQPM